MIDSSPPLIIPSTWQQSSKNKDEGEEDYWLDFASIPSTSRDMTSFSLFGDIPYQKSDVLHSIVFQECCVPHSVSLQTVDYV